MHTEKLVSADVISPAILMPFAMILAAQGWFWTIGWLSLLLMILIAFHYQAFRRKKRTRFFLSWTLTSFLFLLAIFELEVVPYLEILFIENFILMCFVVVMTCCAYFAKLQMALAIPSSLKGDVKNIKDCESDNSTCEICRLPKPLSCHHCKLCGFCIPRHDHHCLWLDTCIGHRNQKLFMSTLLALIMSCCYGANLTLTTVCHPFLFRQLFLLPYDCTDVYGDFHISICYVSAIYMLIVAIAATIKLLQQVWTICCRCVFQDGKHRDYH